MIHILQIGLTKLYSYNPLENLDRIKKNSKLKVEKNENAGNKSILLAIS